MIFEDKEKFFNYFRIIITSETFEKLLHIVSRIQKQFLIRESISAHICLQIACDI